MKNMSKEMRENVEFDSMVSSNEGERPPLIGHRPVR